MSNSPDIAETRTQLIDGRCYVFSYANCVFTFHVDVMQSTRRVPWTREDEWDEMPETRYDIVPNRKPFEVLRAAFNFVHMVLRKHEPFYFRYSAHGVDRFSLYDRVEKRIADQYGYFYLRKGNDDVEGYYFWRIVGDDGDVGG